MESQSNDSSSDGDTSPDTKQFQSNQSDSESLDETASSTLSPAKSFPERVSLNIQRMSKEEVLRTTSLSSQNSDSLNPNLLPGKRAPVKGGHKTSDTERMDYEVPSESKRITRSSRRGGADSSIEPKADQNQRRVGSNKKSTRKTSKILRKKLPIRHLKSKESDYSSEAEEDLYTSSPPLVLLVSIPIENSSINGEDNSSLSDVLSESSELAPGVASSQTKGKHINSMEQDYGSKDSAENTSSSEDSDSVGSSREDSGVEDKNEGVSELVTSEQKELWDRQASSSKSEDSQSESEVKSHRPTRSHKLIACEKIIMSYRTDKSGKSIPNKKRNTNESEKSESRVQPTARNHNKCRMNHSNAAEKNKKNIKHITELDKQLEEGQLGAVLIESYSILRNRDQQAIFSSPVTDDIAPGYSKLIKQPMDFSRMKDKIDAGEYTAVEELFDDFILMCQNAMSYNKPTTFYYRAAKRIKEAGVKSLEKMAKTRITFQEDDSDKILSLTAPPSLTDTVDTCPDTIGPLMVRIDRNLITTSKRMNQLSLVETTPLNAISQETNTETKSHTIDPNVLSAKSRLDNFTVTSQESGSRKVPKEDPLVNPDTLLLPPPSSFTHSLSSKNQSIPQKQPIIESTTQPPKPTTDNNTQSASFPDNKKRHSSLEIKQRKIKKKQEETYLRSFNRAAQARRTYRGSLAPVRPLNYGSFASFAPSYDSSFATINGQETDRVYSLLDHKEWKECDGSMLYTSCDDEVSPYYLRLADGILSLDKDTDSYDKDWIRRTDRDMPPDMIRTHMLRQQAFQDEMRRKMGPPPDSPSSSRVQQQLDDMLQQSAELINSLIQKQGKEDHMSGEEELDKINTILMSIGTTIKSNDSNTF